MRSRSWLPGDLPRCSSCCRRLHDVAGRVRIGWTEVVKVDRRSSQQRRPVWQYGSLAGSQSLGLGLGPLEGHHNQEPKATQLWRLGPGRLAFLGVGEVETTNCPLWSGRRVLGSGGEASAIYGGRRWSGETRVQCTDIQVVEQLSPIFFFLAKKYWDRWAEER